MRPDVLTLGPAPDYAQRRERLLEQGLLLDGVRLLNIYEHFRDHGWGDQAPTGEARGPEPASGQRGADGPTGAPWRDVYRLPDTKRPGDRLPARRRHALPAHAARSASLQGWWRGRIQLVGRGRRGRRRVPDRRAVVPALDPRSRGRATSGRSCSWTRASSSPTSSRCAARRHPSDLPDAQHPRGAGRGAGTRPSTPSTSAC